MGRLWYQTASGYNFKEYAVKTAVYFNEKLKKEVNARFI
jgi:hypothetical protein